MKKEKTNRKNENQKVLVLWCQHLKKMENIKNDTLRTDNERGKSTLFLCG